MLTIQGIDASGTGFNDPTPFTPIGGNNATTLGEARLNVFTQAAHLWGKLITSNVNIVIEASFAPLSCSATTGVLGSAGPLWVFHDFPGAPLPGVFYPAALADALSSQNLAGKDDITATFNSTVNGTASCLGGSYFYYRFDQKRSGPSDGRIYVADLLGVVLHELGHGLGFVSIIDQNGMGITGTDNVTRLGVYEQFLYEESLSMYWPQLSAAQRAQSAIGQSSAGNAALVWNAPQVNGNLARLSAGLSAGGHLKLYTPATWDASSSVSHWDSSATPDLLMEPRYSSTTGDHTDLTTCALYDMGWTGSRCPDGVNAQAQSVNVNKDTAQAITLSASDGDGDVLTYAIVTAPAHGTLSAPNGASVTYTPAAGYTGADQFNFVASDALVSSNTATVSINVVVPTGGGTGGGGGNAMSGSSGGGGAMDLLSLLALALAILRPHADGRSRVDGGAPVRQLPKAQFATVILDERGCSPPSRRCCSSVPRSVQCPRGGECARRRCRRPRGAAPPGRRPPRSGARKSWHCRPSI
jgi:hypothetical protein